MAMLAEELGKAFISPRMEYRRLDFPLPILPRMMVSLPFLISMFKFFTALMNKVLGFYSFSNED